MQVLGRYTVLRRIGAGGMAEVFLARARGAQGTEKLLVLKKIHPALASDEHFLEMFVGEARVAMRLNHGNIVQVYDFERIDDTYVLAMEYVDGADLYRTVKMAREAKVDLPAGLAAHVVREVAKGLDYAHGRRGDRGELLEIVHRDVSPQNVLLGREGSVKIADFGIARARWLSKEGAGALRGKVGYMSPEQARGEPVDGRADIFSLGVVLHELLVGRPLLGGLKGAEALEAARAGAHPMPGDIDSAVPAELDAVVRRALAPRPEDRYPSPREMSRDLGAWLHSLDFLFDATALGDWLGSLLPAAEEEPPAEEPPAEEPPAEEPPAEEPLPAAGPASAETPRLRPRGQEERRPVVAVSARLDVPSGCDEQAIHSSFGRLAEELAYKEGGVIEDDGAGPRIYLGLPLSTFEDAVRGVRVARDLEDAVRGLAADHRIDLEPRVVVSRGDVRFREGARGFDFEPEPDLLKRADLLLDSAGKGECLAGGGIYRLTRWEYNFGPSRLPSGEDPEDREAAKAYPVLTAKSRDERALARRAESRMWGRDDELAVLREAFQRAREGRATLLRLLGDLGIGKSRLLEEFIGSLDADRVRVVRAECLFAERQTPLAAAAAAIRAVLDLPDAGAVLGLRRRLDAFFHGIPGYLRRQETLFGELIAEPEAVWSRRRGNQRELVRRTAFSLGTLIASAARERVMVLVIENAQWLDGPSVDVLSELASVDAGTRLLVLLAGYRDTLTGRHIAGLRDLVLRELPKDVLRRIAADRLGADRGMAEVADQVAARAQGNPFFAHEIIDSLIEQGLIEPVHGDPARRFRRSRPGAIKLPTTMEGLATGQIDVLEPQLRVAARAASVVGAVFTARIVGKLLGRPAERDVRALTERGLLARVTGDERREPRYRFRQPMVREAAYMGLAEADRRRMHMELARDLIAAGGEVPAVRVAWHLERAAEPRRAATYYLEAGDAARRIHSNREAIKLYDRAIPLLPPAAEDTYEAHGRKAKVLRDLGRHSERARELLRMEEIALALEDETRRVRVANERAQLAYDQGDFGEAARRVSLALELGARIEAPDLRVESLRILAYVAAEQGHLVRALDCCRRARCILPEGSDRPYLAARVLNVEGLILLMLGHLEIAPPVLAEALVLFRRIGKRRNESVVMSNMALLAQARGELLEALHLFESAVRIDRQVRDISARGRKLADMGGVRVDLGDFDAAARDLEEARKVCRENREVLGEMESGLGLADLLLQTGELERAREMLDEAERRGHASRGRILAVRLRQLVARVALATGEASRARAAADEAARIAFDAGMNGEVVHGRALQAAALAGCRVFGEAEVAARRAEELLCDLGGVRRAEEAWWLVAKAMSRSGRGDRAARYLERARAEVARKAGLIHDPGLRASYEAHPLVQRIAAGFVP